MSISLDDLDRLPTFALLGPDFAEGNSRLFTGLRGTDWNRRPSSGSRSSTTPLLVYLPYESIAADIRIYAAEQSHAQVDLRSSETAPLQIELDEVGYEDAIADIRQSIAQGDVYQVNYALRARIRAASGARIAAALCRRGMPASFAWIRFPNGDEFVSGSPERFFAIDGARVRCQPMKGTAAPDQASWLLASEKDRAELSMITDLMRNDLVPVCRGASVRVACERRFIQLPYAVQAVSDVEGELLPGIGPLEVLAALHPCGSVTGAPKRAAMRAISRLEPTARSAYCGSLGLVENDRARFSVLIRTAERQRAELVPIHSPGTELLPGDSPGAELLPADSLRDELPPAPSGWIYGVGGGVVWQSNAALEKRELHLKLDALRRAPPDAELEPKGERLKP